MALFETMIPKGQPVMRLDSYIFRALPELPKKAVREAFSHRDVKMGGRRARPEDPLVPGALVQIFTMCQAQEPFRPVYEDENILLANKPAGISVQRDAGGGATMEELAARYMEKTRPGSRPPVLCHRLDHQTCGLLAFAKTPEAEEALLWAFKERKLDKRYACLVHDTPAPAEGEARAYLIKDAQKARVRVAERPAPGALPIITGYRVLEAGSLCRLEARLITGRTHQLRAHLAYLGHPILGDDVYGDRQWNKEQKCRRLCLCACRLTFYAGGALEYLDGRTFTVPVPF